MSQGISLKRLASATILRPIVVRNCSQTLYETALGCSRLYDATGDERWRHRAVRALARLHATQCPDGGFDIGYDFNFGARHRAGESTAPELVGLIAYMKCGESFGFNPDLRIAAERAAEWIRLHARRVTGDSWAIPYGPYSTARVMVYNGTSFAAGALGCYLGRFGGDPELVRIYRGMIRYLAAVLEQRDGCAGKFWYYNEQDRDDLTQEARQKIDYYHQMQQVEAHCFAQKSFPDSTQLSVIEEASEHIAALAENGLPIPYTNNGRFRDQVHIWGFASCAAGFFECATLLPHRAARYCRLGNEILDWVLEYSWQGTHFAPILAGDGRIIFGDYMVRSDAWVFSALAAGVAATNRTDLLTVAEVCHARIEKSDYSGPETHAQNVRLRSAGLLIRITKRVLGAASAVRS